MGKIQDQVAGVCEKCGGETDFTSPEVCYGCVSEAEETARFAAMGLYPADDDRPSGLLPGGKG